MIDYKDCMEATIRGLVQHLSTMYMNYYKHRIQRTTSSLKNSMIAEYFLEIYFNLSC